MELDKVLQGLNEVAGVKGSMIVTPEGIVVVSVLGHGLETDVVAALSSHLIKTACDNVAALGCGSIERFQAHSYQGRLIFQNLGIGYLVVITNPTVKLGQTLIEIDSAARKIKARTEAA